MIFAVTPVMAADYSWPVLRVIDGDTLSVQLPGLPQELQPVSVRVRGVDAPELHGKCASEKAAAQRAKAFTAALVETGAIFRNPTADKYFRIDATVIVRGKDLASMLIGAGLGRPYAGEKRKGWCG